MDVHSLDDASVKLYVTERGSERENVLEEKKGWPKIFRKEVEILIKTDGKRNTDLLFKIAKVNSKIFENHNLTIRLCNL